MTVQGDVICEGEPIRMNFYQRRAVNEKPIFTCKLKICLRSEAPERRDSGTQLPCPYITGKHLLIDIQVSTSCVA